MLKKTIKYVDYDGNEREEDFYFNLTQSEISVIELSIDGGMVKKINKISAEKNGAEIIKTFEEIIFKAYGEKSPDGKRFVKSHELSVAFSQTEAYNQLFMSLITNPEEAAKFFEAIIPQEDQTKK